MASLGHILAADPTAFDKGAQSAFDRRQIARREAEKRDTQENNLAEGASVRESRDVQNSLTRNQISIANRAEARAATLGEALIQHYQSLENNAGDLTLPAPTQGVFNSPNTIANSNVAPAQYLSNPATQSPETAEQSGSLGIAPTQPNVPSSLPEPTPVTTDGATNPPIVHPDILDQYNQPTGRSKFSNLFFGRQTELTDIQKTRAAISGAIMFGQGDWNATNSLSTAVDFFTEPEGGSAEQNTALGAQINKWIKTPAAYEALKQLPEAQRKELETNRQAVVDFYKANKDKTYNPSPTGGDVAGGVSPTPAQPASSLSLSKSAPTPSAGRALRVAQEQRSQTVEYIQDAWAQRQEQYNQLIQQAQIYAQARDTQNANLFYQQAQDIKNSNTQFKADANAQLAQIDAGIFMESGNQAVYNMTVGSTGQISGVLSNVYGYNVQVSPTNKPDLFAVSHNGAPAQFMDKPSLETVVRVSTSDAFREQYALAISEKEKRKFDEKIARISAGGAPQISQNDDGTRSAYFPQHSLLFKEVIYDDPNGNEQKGWVMDLNPNEQSTPGTLEEFLNKSGG